MGSHHQIDKVTSAGFLVAVGIVFGYIHQLQKSGQSGSYSILVKPIITPCSKGLISLLFGWFCRFIR
jgi:hypothetical protein